MLPSSPTSDEAEAGDTLLINGIEEAGIGARSRKHRQFNWVQYRS